MHDDEPNPLDYYCTPYEYLNRQSSDVYSYNVASARTEYLYCTRTRTPVPLGELSLWITSTVLGFVQCGLSPYCTRTRTPGGSG